MYLKALTNDEKEAFLELAYRAARADRILAMEEYELWRAFRFEVGLPEDRYSVREQSVGEAAARFKSDRSRRIAMIELAGMVMADGVQAPEENTFLREVAVAFSLEEKFVVACVDWIKRHGAMMQEGKALVDGDYARISSPA